MKKFALMFSLSILFIVTITSAQDEHLEDTENIFLELLQTVPDILENRNEVYFADRRAIESAYPNTQMPATFADFDALDQPQWIGWFKAVFRLYVPTGMYMRQMATMPDVIGIDYFDTEQELMYGTPPNQGLILRGYFEADPIEIAFANRDYEQVSDHLWCLDGDCTTGSNIDLANVDTSNPFGGHLGRSQPVVIHENWIASSTSTAQLGYLPTGAQLPPSNLAEHPDIFDAVTAINSLGVLIQASIWEGSTVGYYNNFSSLVGNTDIDLTHLGLDDLDGIAPYTLAVFGDIATEDEQVAVVALTFNSTADAEQSLQEITHRLETQSSIITGQSFKDLIEQRLATVSTQVIEGDTYSVGLVMFSAPKATFEQLIDEPAPYEWTSPSMLYSLLLSMITRRDLIWMAYDVVLITD